MTFQHHSEEWRHTHEAPPAGHNEPLSLEYEIQSWVESKRGSPVKVLTADEIGQLGSGKRLALFRNITLLALTRYIRRHPNADVAPVLALWLYFLADNEQGASWASLAKLGKVLRRSDSTMTAALKRLTDDGLFVVLKVPGHSHRVSPVIPTTLTGLTRAQVIGAFLPAHENGRVTPQARRGGIEDTSPNPTGGVNEDTPQPHRGTPPNPTGDDTSFTSLKGEVFLKGEGKRQPPPSDKGSATSDQGTLQGRGELLPIKATKEVLAPTIGAGTLLSGMDDAAYVVEGVRLPLALCVFIEKRQAPMKMLALCEAIRDQRFEGVPPEAIREALVQAIGKADGDTPSAIVGKCITFVSNVSKFRANDAAKQATDKAAAERLKDFEKVVTLKCGDSFVQITGREVNELLDEHQGVLTANEIVGAFKAEGEERDASAASVRKRLADTAASRRDAALWREIIQLNDQSDASYANFSMFMRTGFEKTASAYGNINQMKVPHSSALAWGKWFKANKKRMRDMLRGFACTQAELLACAIIGDAFFTLTTADADALTKTVRDTGLIKGFDFDRRFRGLCEGFDPFDCDVEHDPIAKVLAEKFPDWTPPAPTADEQIVPPAAPPQPKPRPRGFN